MIAVAVVVAVVVVVAATSFVVGCTIVVDYKEVEVD